MLWSLPIAFTVGVGTWFLLLGVDPIMRGGILALAGDEPFQLSLTRTLMYGVGGLVFGSVWSNVVMSYVAGGLPVDIGRPVSYIGATIGAIAAIPFYPATEQLGTGLATDPNTPWEWHHWIWYSLPVAIPAVLAVAAVFAVDRVVREARKWLREKALDDYLLTHGRLTKGTITRLEFLHSWLGDRPRFELTFTYDTATRSRTATRELVTSPAEVPLVGGTVKVWYDADSPDPDRMRFERDPDTPTDPDGPQRYESPSD